MHHALFVSFFMRSWITEGGWEYNRGTEKEGGERWKKAGVLDCKGVRWFGGGRGGCWPTHHSQWMWQPSVDLPAQTPQLMNQTWFPPVRGTPSLRLGARQNKAHLH